MLARLRAIFLAGTAEAKNRMGPSFPVSGYDTDFSMRQASTD